MLKKLFFTSALLFVVLFSVPVLAQTWYTANQVTLAWDAVPKVLATDQANTYQVYSRNDLVSLGSKIGGEVTATQLLISLSAEGRYYLGVKTIRHPVGETVGIPSIGTAWSNVAADTNNSPFGVSYFAAPIFPGGLRLVP
jgi:hypothetical protein